MTPTQRNVSLAIALVLIGGVIWYLESGKASHSSVGSAGAVTLQTGTHSANFDVNSKIYPMAMELVSPDGYINTPASTTLSEFVGSKVVLVDFWTYSCINCQRTIPYLEAWYNKYKDYGFTVVGVHTPEFGFEKVLSNVEAAVKKFAITYPVVLDSNYNTWTAYHNQYWPAEYLIDTDGLVREHNIGEGNYADTEATIQTLLRERATTLGEDPSKIPTGTVDIGQNIDAGSPETYFNYSRNQYLGNGSAGKAGVQNFVLPADAALNTLYLGGTWDIGADFAQSQGAAQIEYTYDAKGVYFVASSPQGADVQVLVDGKPISADQGMDVSAQGTVHIQEPRLYRLIDSNTKQSHTLKLVVPAGVLQAYTFTFG
ncbi:MAG TPA: redoxin domain-containing protein [Candidatus Paceibacterota bacterium]|jgi:thiol-disulfide isomerase/thioredoxin|nr:redoxin domain-containing protein [Candidatus Paceibacterota bacterium]